MGSDMLGVFIITFFVIFFGFAFWGHVTFGADMGAFASPPLAINSAFDMLIGNGDLPGLYQANRAMALIFFFLFTLVMTLILSNVFIAIISDAYASAQEQAQSRHAFAEYCDDEWDGYVWGAFKKTAHKLLMVFTLNLCFTSPAGLPLLEERKTPEGWAQVGVSERITLVLISNLCFVFNFLFLFRIPNIGQDYSDVAAQIYEHKHLLQLSIDRVAEEKGARVGIQAGLMRILFGNAERIEQRWQCWAGPESRRFVEDSTEERLFTHAHTLASKLNVLKEMTEMRLHNPQARFFSSLSAWEERMTILEDSKAPRLDYIATENDFPMDMIRLYGLTSSSSLPNGGNATQSVNATQSLPVPTPRA